MADICPEHQWEIDHCRVCTGLLEINIVYPPAPTPEAVERVARLERHSCDLKEPGTVCTGCASEVPSIYLHSRNRQLCYSCHQKEPDPLTLADALAAAVAEHACQHGTTCANKALWDAALAYRAARSGG